MKQTRIKKLVKITGEELDFTVSTPEEVLELWRLASEYIKAYEYVKDKLKLVIPDFVNDRGLFENNGYQFRYTNVQRMNYDKGALRNLVDDQDLYDDLMLPNKTMIDRLLKEQDPRLWPVSSELRESMIAQGNPFSVIKLEKL